MKLMVKTKNTLSLPILRIWLIYILILSTYSCKSPVEKEAIPKSKFSEHVNGQQNTQANLSIPLFDYSNTSLQADFSDSTYAFFSENTKTDLFMVHISKGKITETEVRINVFNSKNELIYEHIFPTTALIYGYSLEEITSDAEMKQMMYNWAKAILENGLVDLNKLAHDAYPNTAEKGDFMDYDTYKEIKNSNRIMFHYVLGEEEHFYLGFSEKIKKVVQLISCC